MREMNVVEKYDPPKTQGKGKDEGNGKGKEEPQAGVVDIDAIYNLGRGIECAILQSRVSLPK